MARISTYPIISEPTLNDLLIGTDVEDLNITKNFTIGDIASLIIGGSYVPYIGATENVDLGAFDITSSAFIVGGGLATQFLKADGSLDATVYQPAGNYITQLSGEATASGPGNATVTLSNSAVTGKVLTGLTIAGNAIVATDSILTAFGKVQNQINTLVGGVQYKGTWNAATNTPTLVSSVGVQGNYYVVSVAGNTNLNGITDWKLGDWAIFNGSAWEKVDNTDAVISVNGQIGEVVLTTTDIAEGTNLYYTNLRARSAISLTTTGNSGASSYSNLTGILNVPNYTLAGLGGVPLTRELTINGTTFDLSANRSWSVGTVTSIATTGPLTGGTITGSGTIGITQSGASSDGYLSSTDWNTFNNKQNALTNPVTGTGTIFTLPMWSGATSLADSPLSYGPDAFNFQYNSATGGTVNFTNIGLTPYTYAIQMNNFGSPRSTIHSYTDGIVVNSIAGTQVSRMFANGNLILGTGFVDNGYKLEVTGTLALRASASASAATQVPVFIASPSGTTRELVTRTPAQLLGDAGGVTGTGASGQVAFWSGTDTQTGDNGLFWDNTNKRLGVGLTNPQSKLHIGMSGSNAALILSDVGVPNALPSLIFRRGPATANSLSLDFPSNVRARFTIGDSITGIEFVSTPIFLTGGQSIQFGGITGQTATAILGSIHTDNNNGQLLFSTRGSGVTSERMRVNNLGNLLIGSTTDSGFRLDVNGTARVQGVLTTTADAVVNGVNIGIGGGSISTNTRVGSFALNANTTGDLNSAFGLNALLLNTTGTNNIAFGGGALQANTTGGANTAIGRLAGRFIADGATANTISNNSTFLGFDTRANASGQTNQIVIGHTAIGLGSNTTVIGNSSTTFGRWFGNLLVGTSTNAGFALDVNGTARVQGASTLAGTNTLSGTTNISGLSSTWNCQYPNNATSKPLVFSAVFGGSTSPNNTAIQFGYNFRADTGLYSQDIFQNILYDNTVSNVVTGFEWFTHQTQISSLPSILAMSLRGKTLSLGTNTPSESSILQLNSTTQGFLPPRMTTTQKNAIASPATGLIVYDNTLNDPFYFNGTAWTMLQDSITLTTTGTSGPATLVGTTLNIPNYTTALTAYVPYTGANQTVNLNTQQLQAGHATFTTSGSIDTLTINHTSGNGHGIIVNKAGGGEGLQVIKTSGGGNAATITGGITLLSTLNLTNALADTYIASAANWNTAYNNRITSLTTTGTSGAATLVSHVLNIPQYQAQGNYITSLTGEATASGPGAASVTLTNSAVTGKVLTGLTVAGSSIASTDSILTAFGKLQGQVNDLIGGLQYQGTWNASTNTPAITSGVGTDGHFYIVSVAGNTIIDGVGGWQVGDWIVFHSPAWQKVDNTESVVSVNGFTGAVTLTTSNISEGTNLYFTDARARTAISLTTTGNNGASTYNNGTGVLNVPQYTLSGLGGVPTTRALTINGVNFDLSADRTWNVGTVTSITTSGPITGGPITGTGVIGITQSSSSSNGFLSSTDWNTFNGKQNTITLTTTGTSGAATLLGATLNIPQYQSVLTNPITGTGTINYLSKFTGTSAIGDSLLFDSGSGVGIGTASINASALFQMDSTTKGFLPPRMTAAQRGAISAPSQGLIVYQVDGVIGLYIYSNSVWRSLTMV